MTTVNGKSKQEALKASKAETSKVKRNSTLQTQRFFLKLPVPAICLNASSSPTWCSTELQQHPRRDRRGHPNPDISQSMSQLGG